MAEGGQQCALHGAVVKSALRGVGNRLHLCDAPGGTGKTFVERAIIAAVRADGHAVVVGASSGVAATLLPDGRTFHSTFKVPGGADSDGQAVQWRAALRARALPGRRGGWSCGTRRRCRRGATSTRLIGVCAT
mgnify:FL=1